MITYKGHAYIGDGVEVAPREGKPLGRVTLPACNDTGEGGDEKPGEEIELAEIEGVSPSVALAVRGRSDTVLIREDVDYDRLPPALARLREAPKCASGDEPIELSGPWIGIAGLEGKRAREVVPPYNLELYVDESSAKRYERAYLTVRVPAELERPLTRADIRSSLWQGGTISLVVNCRAGRYLAKRVEAHPPP